MKLKYERQWEIVEKICNENKEQIDFVKATRYMEYKKSVIQHVFNIYKYIDWIVFWKSFETLFYNLKLYNWEYQQKPLLDKMIELMLWGRDNN